MNDVKRKWDRIYAHAADQATDQGTDQAIVPKPCSVLSEYAYLLPAEGRALDLACGLGGNALFLGDKGLTTVALDISSEAIEKVRSHQHPLVEGRCEEASAANIANDRFNVIVVSNFLERTLCDALVTSLAPGGLLFYQTFVCDKTDPQAGPGNPDYLLKRNELLSLFSKLSVLAFSDLASVGDHSSGLRNQSFLVAHKKES